MPYYNYGSVEVPCVPSNPGKVPWLDYEPPPENFETSVIVAATGNTGLVEEASQILYGENLFKFGDAKVALWWLKRIGSNLSKLKRLGFCLDEGYMSPFEVRFEKVWYSAFLVLRSHHHLDYLNINFRGWTHKERDDPYNSNVDSEIWAPRQGALRTLLKFRDIKRAIILPGPYLTAHYARVLENALMMPKGQTNQDVTNFEHLLHETHRQKYSMR